MLVVALLDHVKQRAGRLDSKHSAEIADVGTGSGILAVCAAKYVPNSHVTAIDISPAALAVARRNAERHGVADRIEFVESNLLRRACRPNRDSTTSSAIRRTSRRRRWTKLAPDVREHEPDVALRAGERGTDVIAPLIEQAAARLKPGGALFIEISPMIAAEVEQLIRDTSHRLMKLRARTIRDLRQPRITRVVQAANSRRRSSLTRGCVYTLDSR